MDLFVRQERETAMILQFLYSFSLRSLSFFLNPNRIEVKYFLIDLGGGKMDQKIEENLINLSWSITNYFLVIFYETFLGIVLANICIMYVYIFSGDSVFVLLI